jgi:hypothetical protein
MPPEPGAPADATDVWVRVLTSEGYWKRDGTLHNSAFSGSAIAAPTGNKPWTIELSGRLLSLIEKLERESRGFCTPPRVFAGLMYQTVEKLRTDGSRFPPFPTDVIYTPIDRNEYKDPAHADLVAYGPAPTPPDRFLFRDWLQDLIQCVRPHQCAVVEQLRS